MKVFDALTRDEQRELLNADPKQLQRLTSDGWEDHPAGTPVSGYGLYRLRPKAPECQRCKALKDELHNVIVHLRAHGIRKMAWTLADNVDRICRETK